MATAPSGSPSGELLAPAGSPSAAARPKRARTHLLGGITGFIIRRALLSLLVLFIASVLVFLATRLWATPHAGAAGREATPEALAALRKQLHLDDRPSTQYWHWLRDMVTVHWGQLVRSSELRRHDRRPGRREHDHRDDRSSP